MGILFRNVRLVDPASGTDRITDLSVREGLVDDIGTELAQEGFEVIDGTGKILAPGLIDMHVHLREPGFEHKETILTGMRAAAAGGFTRIAAMPNTSPALDTPETLERVRDRASAGMVHVHPIGALSFGLEGREPTDLDALKNAGACAFSDDGMPVPDSAMMYRAMEWAHRLDRIVVDHCEDHSLSRGGVMNRGANSEKLGLPGIPKAAEDIMTARDILLAREYNLPVHICHVSTRTSVELIRQAKADGVRVTGEAAPHHFSLTDDALLNGNTNARVSPPLREEEDREAVLAGLADGTLDIIATDHAPHTAEEKNRPLDQAPNGMVGLETAVGLVFTRLIQTGVMGLLEAIGAMTWKPAQIFGLPGGRIAKGESADLVLIDPELIWKVDPTEFHSKGSNSPFIGMTLKGRPIMTVIGGRKAMENNNVFF